MKNLLNYVYIYFHLGNISDDVCVNDYINDFKVTGKPDWKDLIDEIDRLKSVNVPIPPISFKPKIIFIGDNVDLKTKPRQYSIEKGNVDQHLFNVVAVQNRVNIPDELIGIKSSNINVKDVPFSFFIPTKEDEFSLQNEFKILISRDLVVYFEELDWLKKHIVNHIPHEYTKEQTQKSDVVRSF